MRPRKFGATGMSVVTVAKRDATTARKNVSAAEVGGGSAISGGTDRAGYALAGFGLVFLFVTW